MAKQLPLPSAGTVVISIQGGARTQPPPQPVEREPGMMKNKKQHERKTERREQAEALAMDLRERERGTGTGRECERFVTM